VEVRCHLCQATNPPGAGWCNQCGVRFQPVAVGQPAGPATAAPPGGPGPSFAGPAAPAPPFPGGPPAPGHGGPEPWAPAPQLAGVWPRIGARFLDALLVGVVAGVVGGLLGLPDTVGLLLTLVAMIGYETLMLANGGQTLGKMLLGLRVVRADLAPPAVQDGLVRSLVVDLLWIVPLAWLVLAVVIERHPRRQGWHDRAAGTLVVRSRA
jgi:uncharacterized RDD family membrane protein YckC